MSNRLDPDQARHFVGPDLGPNCFQKLSADDTRRFMSSYPFGLVARLLANAIITKTSLTGLFLTCYHVQMYSNCPFNSLPPGIIFHAFLSFVDFFFKLTFSKNSFRNTI